MLNTEHLPPPSLVERYLLSAGAESGLANRHCIVVANGSMVFEITRENSDLQILKVEIEQFVSY